jgi:hypothetical protein
MCLFAHSGVQHILCCVFILFFFVLCTLCCQFLCFSSYCVPYAASFSVCLRIVYPMLPVSLFFFVLCTLCCQFLCFSSYCVPYVASFSVCLRIVYPMLPVSLFFFVLCTLCCQFLWIVHLWLPFRDYLTFIYRQRYLNTKLLNSLTDWPCWVCILLSASM